MNRGQGGRIFPMVLRKHGKVKAMGITHGFFYGENSCFWQLNTITDKEEVL
jgi:hypothetical protein